MSILIYFHAVGQAGRQACTCLDKQASAANEVIQLTEMCTVLERTQVQCTTIGRVRFGKEIHGEASTLVGERGREHIGHHS